MLQIETWKRVLIWALVVAGLVLAAPNLFYNRVEGHNDALSRIETSGATPELEAQAGQWPTWLPSNLVNLGLDLRGGAHLLTEVRLAEVYESRMESFWPTVRDALRDARSDVGTIRLQDSAPGTLRVRISNPDGMARALEVVRGLAQPVASLTGAGTTDLAVSGEGSDVVIEHVGVRAGGTVVNTNPTYTPRELQHQLHDSGAETIGPMVLLCCRFLSRQVALALKPQ